VDQGQVGQNPGCGTILVWIKSWLKCVLMDESRWTSDPRSRVNDDKKWNELAGNRS
jgi:hypothetical protein